eukprot:PhM_4_TR7720/c0_g1_i1/m.56145
MLRISRRYMCAAANSAAASNAVQRQGSAGNTNGSGAGGGGSASGPGEPYKGPKGYVKSTDAYAHKRKVLSRKYAGETSKQYIKTWEDVFYNKIRFMYTHEKLIGKDRWGNRFFIRAHYVKKRGEERMCRRVDRSLAHQPYGALPVDDRLWERWMRGWRGAPPTPEESENFRRQRKRNMGPRTIGDEEGEDALMRNLAHLHAGAAYANELDPDQDTNNFLNSQDKRTRDGRPDSPWTMGFSKGDLFYNEEEVEVMRGNLEGTFRDKYWQALEMERHRLDEISKELKLNNGKPTTYPKLNEEDNEPQPFMERPVRPDRGQPYFEAKSELKTPELERLRLEVEHMEQDRHRVRKELGLTDISDEKEGREPADPGPTPFAPGQTSARWKPKCWHEPWGQGGGQGFY